MYYSLPKSIYCNFDVVDNKSVIENLMKDVMQSKRLKFISEYKKALKCLCEDIADFETENMIFSVGEDSVFYYYPVRSREYKIKNEGVIMDNRAIGMLASLIAFRNIAWDAGKTKTDHYFNVFWKFRDIVFISLKSIIDDRKNNSLIDILSCTAIYYYSYNYSK